MKLPSDALRCDRGSFFVSRFASCSVFQLSYPAARNPERTRARNEDDVTTRSLSSPLDNVTRQRKVRAADKSRKQPPRARASVRGSGEKRCVTPAAGASSPLLSLCRFSIFRSACGSFLFFFRPRVRVLFFALIRPRSARPAKITVQSNATSTVTSSRTLML